MVISTEDSSRMASSKEKESTGGMMGRPFKVASREDCCMEEAYGVQKITTTTRDNTDKIRNMGRVSISGVME